MSAPATKQEWQDLSLELLAFRAGRSADSFMHVFGVDPAPLIEWSMADADDTMVNVIPHAILRGGNLHEAVAGALGTHTFLGIEMGLYLVSSGRVKP